MLFRKFKNEKGITLVELLAALSLFAVVIALSSTVIVQMMGGAEKANDSISLQQDTNVLMSELRSQYYDGESELCFNIDGKRFAIQQLTINDVKVAGNDSCIKVNRAEPLTIKLTTASTNDSGEKLSVQTTWNNKEEYVLNITSKKSGGFDEESDFEEIVRNENEVYTDYHTKLDGQGSCTFEGNSKFNQGQWGDWNACNNTAVINGHNWFPENTSVNGVNLTVDKNLYADSNFTMERNANIIVKNNARIEGQSILKSTSTVEINNLYANSDFTIQESARLHARGGARIGGPLLVMGQHSKLLIDGNFFSEGRTTFQEGATIKLGGNATFEKYLKMMGKAEIIISGNAYFLEGVDIQSNSKIIIRGDAQFDGSVGYDWSYGTICVKGDATFNSTVGSNLKIMENAITCK